MDVIIGSGNTEGRYMRKKLVFLDVDGTLAPPGSYDAPASAIRAVKRAQENGHKVFLCSGRNYCKVEPLLRHGFDGGITSCGGYIVAGDKVIYDCPLTEEQKNTAMDLFTEEGVFMNIEAKDDSYCDEGPKQLRGIDTDKNSLLLSWVKAVWVDLGGKPLEEYDGRPLYKIVFICYDEHQLDSARNALGDELFFLIHDFSEKDLLFGEIVNRKFDKGTAVRRVAEELGFDIEDTIGFGDSMNDVELIETVGTSVCMGNGSPQLKEMSDMVCPAFDEDGIEWGFRELGLI